MFFHRWLPRRLGAGRCVTVGILAFCWLAILVCPALRGAEAKRPNIVFILTDDQNFDTIGCFGSKVLTPNLDRLAKEGVKFTRA